MVNTLTGTRSVSSWMKKAVPEKVAGGFEFTEGPFWHPDGYFIFSDTPANCIYRLYPDGETDLYVARSGLSHDDLAALSDQVGSNGLAMDGNHRLFICQHGNHAIAMLDEQKKLTVVADRYNDTAFNSPNDIAIRSDGIIYFTDPPYGLAGQVLRPEQFQPFAGIYRYDGNGVVLLGTELQYPNGICFSPDEQWLYVSTNHPGERYLLRYKVFANGDIQYDSILAKENADGIKIDQEGNVFMATDNGIMAVSPHGEKLGLISLPDTPSNLAWGGSDNEMMLITARSSLYLLTL